MNGWRGALICGITLYLAAAAQQSIARWTLVGGRVDYLLLALTGLCLFASRRGGAVIGFFAGWLFGALDGANMWQYIVTRTILGFLIAGVAESGIERNFFSALLAGMLGVIVCQFGLMFLAPPSSLGQFVGDTIRTAVYNGVLAMLLYACLNRILGPRR